MTFDSIPPDEGEAQEDSIGDDKPTGDDEVVAAPEPEPEEDGFDDPADEGSEG